MNNTIYELKVTTWENDGDHYQTNSVIVTSQEDHDFYVQLINMFRSCNARNNPGLGNEEISEETLQEVVEELMEEHPNMSLALKNEWIKSFEEEEAIEKLQGILGNPVDFDYNFCRVVESINVTKIKPSDWIITKKHQKAVFSGIDNNKAVYFYDDFGTKEGQVDIFSRVWLKDMCDIKEVSYFRAGNEISVQVLNLH